MKEKVALLGFRGIGKSTIGRQLRQLLGYELVSLDQYIESKNKMTIEEMVKAQGWAFFRAEETRCLAEIAAFAYPLILDTGGGVLEEADGSKSAGKQKILRDSFYCIYLTMPDQLILKRLEEAGHSHSRVALSAEPAEVLQRRKPVYAETADLAVSIENLSAREAAVKIHELLADRAKRSNP